MRWKSFSSGGRTHSGTSSTLSPGNSFFESPMAARILNSKCICLSQSDSVQDDDVRERFKGCVEGSRVRDKIESG